ncbi:MAG: twin-arginine translocation signal domain-containing protein [Polyangiaceae bacterium]
MVIERLKNLQGPSRRNFIKWSATAAAALGIERSGLLNYLSDSAGVAMADAASCAATNRSVHIIAGDGGFAWFQLLWPHVEIAQSNNDNFSYHAFGQGGLAAESDRPLYLGPQAPWKDYGKTKLMTGFMAGQNQTHTPTPGSAAVVGNNQSMMAVVAAIQRATPSLLPVIAVNPLNFGGAPGAPNPTTVANADGLVQLFNSAASRQILSVPEDAALFEAYYKAFVGLNRAAARPTEFKGLRIGKQSANFLGKNLAAQLQPTQDDLDRYGIVGNTPNKVQEIAKIMITAVRAFKLGLTQAVVLPAMRDDPHGAFGDMANLQMTVTSLGKILDEFMNDCQATPDPACSSRNLSDSIVLTVHGDTPKDPRDRSGWPDGTPNNSNWLFAMGNGFLKTGWFGGVKADGSTDGYDPTTGKTIPNQQSNTNSAAAGAAVAYAVAKGDMRRVQDFYNGPAIDGLVNLNPLQ